MVEPRTIKRPASPEEEMKYHSKKAEKIELNRKKMQKNLSV